jgi:hypothetical protein
LLLLIYPSYDSVLLPAGTAVEPILPVLLLVTAALRGRSETTHPGPWAPDEGTALGAVPDRVIFVMLMMMMIFS